MSVRSNRLAAVLAVGGGLAAATSASAATLVTDFNNFTPNSVYGSWASAGATLTSGPTNFTVQSTDFGGGFYNVVPDVNATGETTIELDVTVNSGFPGVVLALGDSDFTEWNYGWFGLAPGNHVLTAPINTPLFVSNAGSNPTLNLSALDFIHIQVDDGPGANAYSVSYNNLLLTGVPEPTAVGLAAIGLAATMARRRR